MLGCRGASSRSATRSTTARRPLGADDDRRRTSAPQQDNHARRTTSQPFLQALESPLAFTPTFVARAAAHDVAKHCGPTAASAVRDRTDSCSRRLPNILELYRL